MGRGVTGDQNYYTVTRLSQDGTSPSGKPYYKREVILFNNTEDLKSFNELGGANKSQLGANGAGVVIATGSTDPNKKSFEFNDKAYDVDFLNTKRLDNIKNHSSNQVRDIVKDENSEVKKGVADFSNKKKGNSKDDAIDSKASENKQKALDKRLARGKYPDKMFYPSHIADSVQDKLKITIFKPKDANSSSTNRKRFISRKVGDQLLPSDYKNLDVKKYPELAAVFNNKQGKYVGTGIRDAFQTNQDKIYAAGENINQPEFDKSPIGHIFLPIPDGVTDQNKVNFGEGTLNPLQKLATGAALEFFEGKVKKEESTGAVLKRKFKDPKYKKSYHEPHRWKCDWS